jgi:hypothetical protein
MATFRQVDIRIWHDRKFLACNDDGRMLWLFLLTTTFARSIPGVIVAGNGAMSEELGWSPSRLGRGFLELTDKGLTYRREGRLTWLPNALKYQPVGGENAIIGMGKIWDDIPDGPLKLEIWEALRIVLKRWSGLFAKHLPKPLGQPIAQPPTQGGGRQEQDTDTEQETDTEREDSDHASRVVRSRSDLLQFKLEVDQSAPAINAGLAHPRKPRKPKPIATDAERAVAMRVLAKLGDRNGVRYSGSNSDVRKIVHLLRSGLSEFDLRAIVAYCCDELDWLEDPKQRQWLRPSTLFGPETHEKYLDPARAYVQREGLSIAPIAEAS